MVLKNILEFFVAAYVLISSAFFSHHSSCILWACLWRCLKQSRFEVEAMPFCHSMKTFLLVVQEFFDVLIILIEPVLMDFLLWSNGHDEGSAPFRPQRGIPVQEGVHIPSAKNHLLLVDSYCL